MSIDINNISYSIKDLQILRDVSLTIKKNEVLSLLGPNGSGKSTLLKIISGDIKPQSGSVLFDKINLDNINHGETPIGDVRPVSWGPNILSY